MYKYYWDVILEKISFHLNELCSYEFKQILLNVYINQDMNELAICEYIDE